MIVEEEKDTSTRKTRQIATSDPIVQTKGTPKIIIICLGRLDGEKDTPRRRSRPPYRH